MHPYLHCIFEFVAIPNSVTENKYFNLIVIKETLFQIFIKFNIIEITLIQVRQLYKCVFSICLSFI